jgi:hypothetical protein
LGLISHFLGSESGLSPDSDPDKDNLLDLLNLDPVLSMLGSTTSIANVAIFYYRNLSFFAFVLKKTLLTFIPVFKMKNFYRSETFCFDFKKYSGVQQMLSFAL